jgi:hypothetical protein
MIRWLSLQVGVTWDSYLGREFGHCRKTTSSEFDTTEKEDNSINAPTYFKGGAGT